jgi:anaerobic ribonucleoside-triphosphate reductase activating protein
MLSFSGGTAMSVGEVVSLVTESQRDHSVEGITLLGGEPFSHAAGASALAEATQARGLSVMVFSGHMIEVLRQRQDADVDRLLTHTDILVDGPYRRELPDTSRRWIGSTNQRIHFLSDRYRASDPCWQEPETLEIRFTEGELAVNGFPARQAVGMWKRPKHRAIGR